MQDIGDQAILRRGAGAERGPDENAEEDVQKRVGQGEGAGGDEEVDWACVVVYCGIIGKVVRDNRVKLDEDGHEGVAGADGHAGEHLGLGALAQEGVDAVAVARHEAEDDGENVAHELLHGHGEEDGPRENVLQGWDGYPDGAR